MVFTVHLRPSTLGVAGEALVCGVGRLGVSGGDVGKAGDEGVQRKGACEDWVQRLKPKLLHN